MPTVTWSRLGGERRSAVVDAAEAEFAAHGFSGGSLNVDGRLRHQRDRHRAVG